MSQRDLAVDSPSCASKHEKAPPSSGPDGFGNLWAIRATRRIPEQRRRLQKPLRS